MLEEKQIKIPVSDVAKVEKRRSCFRPKKPSGIIAMTTPSNDIQRRSMDPALHHNSNRSLGFLSKNYTSHGPYLSVLIKIISDLLFPLVTHVVCDIKHKLSSITQHSFTIFLVSQSFGSSNP